MPEGRLIGGGQRSPTEVSTYAADRECCKITEIWPSFGHRHPLVVDSVNSVSFCEETKARGAFSQ